MLAVFAALGAAVAFVRSKPERVGGKPEPARAGAPIHRGA
jgi:hypothetical protein